MRRVLLTLVSVLTVCLASEAWAQQQRGPDMSAKLQRSLGDASLQQVSAREALQWLSDITDIHILTNWDRLELAGVDPDQTVQVPPGLTAAQAIDIIVQQMEEFEPMIWEPRRSFVQIMTKDQANQRPVMRIYPIEDLLMEMPHFSQSPSFDLNEITRGDNRGGGGRGGRGGGGRSGGGSGGGSGGLFSGDDFGEDDPGLDRTERAEQIADLIREVIEPDIWQMMGGEAGSIRYYQGSLIIRAPDYVHRQIGLDQAMQAAQPLQLRGATGANPSRAGGGYLPRRQGALLYRHRDVGIR